MSAIVRTIVWLSLVCTSVVLDQWTKLWAVAELKDKNQIIDVLPVLRLYYAENHGAAFGMLSDQGGWQKWFFLAIGVAAIIVLTYLIIQSSKQFWLPLGYALILSGAIGNVYDRAALGYVRDMISVYYEPIHFYFAIFNVADMAICIGVAALMVDWLLSLRRPSV